MYDFEKKLQLSFVHIAAIYLNVAMALSMLSLLATVVVLAVHHRNDSTPVPQWLKIMLQLQPKTSNKDKHKETDSNTPGDEFGNVIPTERFELELDVIRSNTNNTVNYDKLQTTILCGILLEMKENKNTATSATESQEWKLIAEGLDIIFFCLFLVVTVITNLVTLTLYMLNT